MPVEVTATLRKLLRGLETERGRIDRQIDAVRLALDGGRSSRGRRSARESAKPKGRRPRMSAAARKAVGERMKAYWAKRRAAEAKNKRGGKKAA